MNSINRDNDATKIIDFTKYLNCPDCKESGLYCPQHRIEVEKMFEQVTDYFKK